MPRASFFLRLSTSDRDDPADTIFGEATEHGYVGTIEVTSWDWGVSDKDKDKDKAASNDGTSATSGASARGSSSARIGQTGLESYEPTPLRFSKQTDRSTTRLLKAMWRGEVFPNATFTLRQEFQTGIGGGRTKHEEFLLHLRLEDVRVTGYDFNARAENAGVDLSEDWVFSYKSIQLDLESAQRLQGRRAGVEFILRPGSTTKALKKPQPSNTDLQRQLDELREENDRLRRAAGKDSNRSTTR